jgi:hypothetical protein
MKRRKPKIDLTVIRFERPAPQPDAKRVFEVTFPACDRERIIRIEFEGPAEALELLKVRTFQRL